MYYKRLIIYYFTGTGNALKAARWMADEAAGKGLVTEIHPIDRKYKPDLTDLKEKTLIGFLSATHGFNVAPAMMKFMFGFPGVKNADVFFLNTRAGMKLYKIFTPGLSGAAQFLPMLIMKFKGYNVRGGRPLDMPSNWISIHPGLRQKIVNSIAERCERITRKFTNKLLERKKVFTRMLIDIPVDIAIIPIAIGYYFIGRFFLAKTFVFTSKCNDCGICSSNCPVSAIKIINGKPFWTYRCESCMRCMNICPRKAIQTSHLYAAFGVFLFTIPFTYYIVSELNLDWFPENKYLMDVIDNILVIFIIIFIYFFLQKILKVKFINHIFRYTSFTNYWRRYRAPGIKVKDFKSLDN